MTVVLIPEGESFEEDEKKHRQLNFARFGGNAILTQVKCCLGQYKTAFTIVTCAVVNKVMAAIVNEKHVKNRISVREKFTVLCGCRRFDGDSLLLRYCSAISMNTTDLHPNVCRSRFNRVDLCFIGDFRLVSIFNTLRDELWSIR